MLHIIKLYNNEYGPSLFGYNTNKGNKVLFRMTDDIFAKSRNGHLLKDTFDKDNNSLDIFSNGLYPANVLSNLSKKPFVYDGVECLSIEGFLQSLKTDNIPEQKEICKLYGGSAKNISKKYSNWVKTQKLYWNGKEYDRCSPEYKDLLMDVFKNCYEQNHIFKTALDSTKNIKLTHIHGNNNPQKTVLTSDEFIDILTKIRDKSV